MTSGIYTICENDDIAIPLKEMRKHEIGRLPVVNNQNQLKGIVTLHNLLAKAGIDDKLKLIDTDSGGEKKIGMSKGSQFIR